MIPLFWTSGDASSGFQSQSWQSFLHLVYVTHSLRFTCGVTPAVLLVTSMAADNLFPINASRN